MSVMTDAQEQAIRDLTRHCGDGRLTLDELEERIDEVNRASTDEEIRHALRELPATRVEPILQREAEPEPEREHVIPDAVLGSHPVGRHRHHPERGSLESTLRAVWVIGGFIALFNGLFWLAIILWFVVPKLVLPNIRRI